MRLIIILIKQIYETVMELCIVICEDCFINFLIRTIYYCTKYSFIFNCAGQNILSFHRLFLEQITTSYQSSDKDAELVIRYFLDDYNNIC
jgi:hypothetical protein